MRVAPSNAADRPVIRRRSDQVGVEAFPGAVLACMTISHFWSIT